MVEINAWLAVLIFRAGGQVTVVKSFQISTNFNNDFYSILIIAYGVCACPFVFTSGDRITKTDIYPCLSLCLSVSLSLSVSVPVSLLLPPSLPLSLYIYTFIYIYKPIGCIGGSILSSMIKDYLFIVMSLHLNDLVLCSFIWCQNSNPRPWFNICHLIIIGNPMLEKRRSTDRLISTMGIPILVRWHLYTESPPNSTCHIHICGWVLHGNYRLFYFCEVTANRHWQWWVDGTDKSCYNII